MVTGSQDDVRCIYFEDIELGQPRLLGIYPVEKDAVIDFANAWDPQPFHIDEEAARQSVFGVLTGSSIHMLAAMSRVTADNKSEKLMVMANLSTEFNMPKPMRVGDTLYFESTPVDKRESRSRPGAGLVWFRTTAKNQHDEIIMHHKATVMMTLRPQQSTV